jgi:hypothetical protein
VLLLNLIISQKDLLLVVVCISCLHVYIASFTTDSCNKHKKKRDQYKDHVRTARDERHMNDIVSRMALK